MKMKKRWVLFCGTLAVLTAGSVFGEPRVEKGASLEHSFDARIAWLPTAMHIFHDNPTIDEVEMKGNSWGFGYELKYDRFAVSTAIETELLQSRLRPVGSSESGEWHEVHLHRLSLVPRFYFLDWLSGGIGASLDWLRATRSWEGSEWDEGLSTSVILEFRARTEIRKNLFLSGGYVFSCDVTDRLFTSYTLSDGTSMSISDGRGGFRSAFTASVGYAFR